MRPSAMFWKTPRQKGAQRLILVVIAEHADKNGLAWPSIQTIARLANCSARFVKETIAKLKSGELVIERGGGRGDQIAIEYRSKG